MSNSTYYNCHQKWNGSSWNSVGTLLPSNFYIGSAVVLNGEIHILGGATSTNKHYKYKGSSWVELNSLPYKFTEGCAISIKGCIYIFGSSDSNNTNNRRCNYKLKCGTYLKGYVKANTDIYLPYPTEPISDNLEKITDGYRVTEDGLVEILID